MSEPLWAIVEWTDKDGRLYRTAPFDSLDKEACKSAARKAFESMCQPVPKLITFQPDGNFIVEGDE